MLVGAGHEVIATTRSEQRARGLREAGAEAAVLDATDLEAIRVLVDRVRPEVVINQLTRLPDRMDPRDYAGALAATNKLRADAGPVLAQAAADAGAKRLISQSVAFMYAPTGDWVKDEGATLVKGGPSTALKALEDATLGTRGIDGVVLRYGYFYGPGTYYAATGATAQDVRRRRFPIIGKGEGVFSFIHVEDAATATLAAVERGAPGIYNVVDDEPSPQREWLPYYAEAIGAKRPLKVPLWVAKRFGGPLAEMAATLRGASNAKAKAELGWEPRYASWRQGFRDALG